MPTSTDLVTDLPADFAVFGQAVDTSMADLKGGTTGQVLSKATATDMDFTWVTPEIGDITAITVTSPITGGGTSGSVGIAIQDGTTAQKGAVQLTDSTSSTSTITAATPNAVKTSYDLANTANTAAGTAQTTANAAIPKSTVTTAGDVIYATGSSAATRLAIGTAGQVLTVNSGATAPQWSTPTSGGMTLINTGGTTLSGASVIVSSIPTTYKHLCVIIRNFIPASDAAYLTVRYNDDSTANRHRGNWGYFSSNADGATAWAFDSTTSRITSNNDNAVGNGLAQAWFFDYANTTTWKSHSFQSLGTDSTTTTSFNILSAVGQYNQTSAITSLRFLANTGNLTSGTVFIYGVN